jgi:hypothetical protein
MLYTVRISPAVLKGYLMRTISDQSPDVLSTISIPSAYRGRFRQILTILSISQAIFEVKYPYCTQ